MIFVHLEERGIFVTRPRGVRIYIILALWCVSVRKLIKSYSSLFVYFGPENNEGQ